MEDINWKGERISRFVLGTAQLGMDYGIANICGQPNEQSAFKIVKTAMGYGVNCFDTAQAYGNSEIILGGALKYCGAKSDIKVISKLSPDLQLTNNKAVEQSIKTSCQNLGVDQLWCLMLHRAEQLDSWDKGLGQTLIDAVKQEYIKYIGVSIYSPDEARRALEHSDIQIIQAPCNAWDQRIKTAGILELAKSLNKLCFVRSIYLQGLLIISTEEVSNKLPKATNASKQWHNLAKDNNLRPIELAVGFANSLEQPLVIGVDNADQVTTTFSLLREVKLSNETIENIQIPIDDEDIIIPSRWGVLRG